MFAVNSLHLQTLRDLEKLKPKGGKKQRLWVQKYLGSDKPTRCIKSVDIGSLARIIVREYGLDEESLAVLLDSLYSKAATFEEIHLAGCIVGNALQKGIKINPAKLDYWLNFTHGWAEMDVLCQSNFTAETILLDWNTWKKLLVKFVKDKNVHKKRASLVLLVKSVRETDDSRLSDLAFKNTDLLKTEKDILITKAISWILRSLIANHKQKVTNYLDKNRDTLPKIAVREVSNKLTTGKKVLSSNSGC